MNFGPGPGPKSPRTLRPIALGPLIDPLPHILQHEIGTLVGLTFLEDDGHVTPSEVPWAVRNGAVTLEKLSCMYWHTLANSLMVPTLGGPVYLRGLEAMIFNFSGSLMAFPTILLSGIVAHRSGEDQARPRVRFRLEVHEHGGCAAHGLAEQEGRKLPIGLAPADVKEERERGGGDLLHIAEVASEAVGAAVAEEIGGEDGVAPSGEVDADLLEEPAGVGAVSVGHEDGGLEGSGRVQGEEGLGEDLAIGSIEVGFGVSDALGGVVFVFRHKAPEIGRGFGSLGFGCHVGNGSGREGDSGGQGR
ncbi:hypothetical protein G2W53_028303 [Senna tora]|uniref:Uncharacterized protein n=1 Tax=Senna tora TaxID=362788 RepID=A0A834TC69_9FABA|nr:hypothetical protein G2W53_028303 [Senna tora]